MKKFNKRETLKRLLKVDGRRSRNFWAREMKALNDLVEKFDNLDFWQKVNFSQNFNSLLFFKKGDGLDILTKKYREFNYKVPEPKKFNIGKTIGENRVYKNKPKTIKDFLNE